MKQNIIFSGGGSGGHLMTALTLIDELKKSNNYNLHYIGSGHDIEKELLSRAQIPYYEILTGKLRRYFSVQNFIDLFKVIIGILQSMLILLKFSKKDTLIFSTGGFVAVPVVISGFLTGKKIFIHEQTSRIGLANKISSFFATKIFVSFEESQKFFPKKKTFLTGIPLRDECYTKQINSINLEGININKIARPIIFVTGGGNGAALINQLIMNHLEEIQKKYFIIHQVGRNFIGEYLKLKNENYLPISFATDIIDLFKISKVVISRAGAGTVWELMALNKKSIFIPLKIAQKNEQFHNALEAQKKLGSIIITEDEIPDCNFMEIVDNLVLGETHSPEISTINGKEKIISEIQNA